MEIQKKQSDYWNEFAGKKEFTSNLDRVFFNYHRLDKILVDLSKNSFDKLKVFEVDYSKEKGKADMHTIVVAGKN